MKRITVNERDEKAFFFFSRQQKVSWGLCGLPQSWGVCEEPGEHCTGVFFSLPFSFRLNIARGIKETRFSCVSAPTLFFLVFIEVVCLAALSQGRKSCCYFRLKCEVELLIWPVGTWTVWRTVWPYPAYALVLVLIWLSCGSRWDESLLLFYVLQTSIAATLEERQINKLCFVIN